MEDMNLLAQLDAIPEDDTLAEAQRWDTLLAVQYVKAQESGAFEEKRLTAALLYVQDGLVRESPTRGCWLVPSRTTPNLTHQVSDLCTCDDRLPWCAHRIAVALYKRTHHAFHAPAPETSTSERTAPANDPETPRTIAIIASDLEAAYLERYTWTKGQTKAIRYAGLLLVARMRGLHTIEAKWTYNDEALSLAEAIVVFADGSTYTESGDATPTNVTKGVSHAWRRMALTRAKARALRDALGIDMVAFEELMES